MTYAYYHNVIKGKSPKNAPTYIAEEKPAEEDAAKYVCGVCGYVYEGDVPFEELGFKQVSETPVTSYTKSYMSKVPGFAAAWALFLAGLSFYNHRVEKNKKQDDDKQDKEG